MTRANRYNVPLSFLSQQAAWLYENQLSQVRAQLRKANKPSPIGPRIPEYNFDNDVVEERPIASESSRGKSYDKFLRCKISMCLVAKMATNLSHHPKEKGILSGRESGDGLRMMRGISQPELKKQSRH